MRPASAILSIPALHNNLARVRQYAPQSKIMAVVKANAYGHGLLTIAQALPSADGFAVSSLEEAIALRDGGITVPILLLEGLFCEKELAEATRIACHIVIHNAEQLAYLSHLSAPLHVHLKLNSGMNRLGFPPTAFKQAFATLRSMPKIQSITLMTHFANADNAQGIASAYQVFCQSTQDLNAPCSLANSASLIRFAETRSDWVRPGIMLYGVSPIANTTSSQFGLQPVMCLRSRLIHTQTLARGEKIGYGGSFTAPHPMRIGIVAMGYADGYPRHAPSGTPVAVCEQRTSVIGTVSMDMLCVDISHIPAAQVGSPVELWGNHVSVEEVAQYANTISYELLCAISARVPLSVET